MDYSRNIYTIYIMYDYYFEGSVFNCILLESAYMPYLTLWDKISQNLAHLEASSHKIIKSHRIFRPSYNTFYEEINISHTLLFISQASYI